MTRSLDLLKTPGTKPDFVLVTFHSLLSLVKNHGQNNDRKVYGILFDSLEPKFLKKTVTKAMLTERPGYQCIPIDFNHLELLNIFGIKITFQKLANHLAKYGTE